MKLSTVVYQFFGNYLPHIKGVSSATIKTYRDAFTLSTGVKIDVT